MQQLIEKDDCGGFKNNTGPLAGISGKAFSLFLRQGSNAMCGITGYYCKHIHLKEEDLRLMTRALKHRGPDAEGYFTEEPAALGHRRLTIIDLSEAANQPMHSHCGRFIIVYNGEVYNFREIARELNIPLKTTSDTEVILEAYARWGPDCFDKFIGMFAMAIYDRQQKQLILCRDRLGIKPLFYYYDGNVFAFASEIKGLLQLGYIRERLKLRTEAIRYFLYLGYIPQPMTVFESIFKFPAGNYAVFDGNGFTINPYWRIEEQVSGEVLHNPDEAKNQLKSLLISSIQYRLICDVPYGAFLSGGTDSSLVAAIANTLTSRPIKTFTIGFEEASFNEAEYARKVARHIGSDHHEMLCTYRDALELFDEITSTYDEPFADTSAVPTMLVSRFARQHVTMTLSGDGGDELFLGYGFYRWAKRLSNPLVRLAGIPASMVLDRLSSKYQRIAWMFRIPDNTHFRSHIFSQEQYYFSLQELEQILLPEYHGIIELNENPVINSRDLAPEELQSIFDIQYYLKDDLLVKVDRASMKYSLEARVPLLDHRIVRFAMNIAPDLKIRGNVSKYLLRQVLYDYVPPEYFDRPKWGFGMPVGIWMKNELRHWLDDYLNQAVVNKCGLVNYAVVKDYLKALMEGKDYLYNRIWLLVILHKWYLNYSSQYRF